MSLKEQLVAGWLIKTTSTGQDYDVVTASNQTVFAIGMAQTCSARAVANQFSDQTGTLYKPPVGFRVYTLYRNIAGVTEWAEVWENPTSGLLYDLQACKGKVSLLTTTQIYSAGTVQQSSSVLPWLVLGSAGIVAALWFFGDKR